MNKSAIKGFSVRARRKLIEDISQKAFALGIKETGKYDDIEEFEGGFRVKNAVNQIIYPLNTKKDREKLIAEINRKGFEQVVEEVAYTWFNRIIAIRFMEINEYLPVKVRILSSEVEGKTEPDVITHIYDYVSELELDGEKVFNLKENHKDEELFKYVFVKECNNLGKLMPQVFESIGDYTELLLPDQLLSSGSVVRDLVESIDEEDFREQVEIIGWMYQYYISERKAIVDKNVSKGKKVNKEDLPAKTQLFTPQWIVKYMVENTLGRVASLNNISEEGQINLEYFSGPEAIDLGLPSFNDGDLTKVRFIDPAMGSGHILVYAFDLFYELYLLKGYSSKEIPRLIIENNLYGVDIDLRAMQLASFALIMKARSRNKRFFQDIKINQLRMNLIAINSCEKYPRNIIHHIVDISDISYDKNLLKDIYDELVSVFKDAKELGSLVDVKNYDYKEILKITQSLSVQSLVGDFQYLESLINQAMILNNCYDVVVTNPPYLGHRSMSTILSSFAKSKYNNSKRDLSSMFMEKCIDLTKKNGLVAMINQHSWMFLDSYKKLRSNILNGNIIVNLLHLGSGAFEEISGEVVQSVTFVLSKQQNDDFKGHYFDLKKYANPIEKEKGYLRDLCDESYFKTCNKHILEIPDSPIAYWVTEDFRRKFTDLDTLGNIGTSKQGLITANNDRFLRFWFEIDFSKIGFGFKSEEDSINSTYKWFPYIKGGEVRPWYGNLEYVVNYFNGGSEIKCYRDENGKLKSRPQNIDYYFKSGITWSDVSTSPFYARFIPEGFIFDASGPMYFCDENKQLNLLGYMNSSVFKEFLDLISPGLHYGTGHIPKVPYITADNNSRRIQEISRKSIELMKVFWDDLEISWDFSKSPLLEFSDNLLEVRVRKYLESRLNTANDLAQLERELSNIYGNIQNETYNYLSLVPDEKDCLKAFLSYAIGVFLGKYSLENSQLKELQVVDNLIIISENHYFENDIVNRLRQFLIVIFGEKSLNDNMKYIAKILSNELNKSPTEAFREYFQKHFYSDHLSMYRRDKFKLPRPIYWMIDSGKQNGIKALFYMHRYDKSTVARFRTDYLHEIQRYYENDIELTEKSNDKKKVDNLKKKLQEVTEFDKVVAHIAHQQIEFDLDDGVEYNYELFQGVEVPQGDGQKSMKADLLAKRK